MTKIVFNRLLHVKYILIHRLFIFNVKNINNQFIFIEYSTLKTIR